MAKIGDTEYDLSDPVQRESYWTRYAVHALIGHTINAVRYMTHAEAEQMGWSSRPLVIQLSNGNLLIPSSDDEGNDGGALFDNEERTFPVL